VTADTVDGSLRLTGRLDPVGGATVMAALDARSRKASHTDQRSYPQRVADALVELAQAALDRGELPQVAAQRPHVIMTVPAQDAARLDGVGSVSAPTAQLIGCDSDITPVMVARNGAVLDLGRTTKTPSRAQRLAVITRDQTCVGCGAPASRCQIHHVRWWARDHGPTDEPNLCLVCWDCHHRIHHDRWTLTRKPDGRYTMHPPDADRGRRRP
jgi:NAD-dependent dihydropyrimidine dehydrogenase PreA subunit